MAQRYVFWLIFIWAVHSLSVDFDDDRKSLQTFPGVPRLNLVITNEYLESVKDTAKTIADDLITHYIKPGTGTLGESSGSLLPYPPYFWWESGAMWGVMLDYWSATGDSAYNLSWVYRASLAAICIRSPLDIVAFK